MSEETNQSNQSYQEEPKSSFNWKWILYGAVGVYFVSKMFSGGGEEKDYYEEKLTEMTGGLVTHVKEMSAENFKITDEEYVEAREDSRIIASFKDGAIDTFTLEEATLTETTGRTSGMRSVLYGGLMGYMMGKNMSRAPSSGVYADKKTFDRVQSKTGTKVANRATTRTVKRPSSSKKGYGSGKSTRSYGG